MLGSYDFPSASYDAWKTRSPDDDWIPPLPCYDWEREPEFYCEECDDIGFVWGGELCPACQSYCDLEDAYERTDIDFIYTAKEH